MTKNEALTLALEALKQIDEAMPFPVAKLAQKAIKEALAQPEHEPVGFAVMERPWVGLTDEDKAEILNRKWWNFEDEFDLDGFMRLVEAKLKEKNT